MMEQQGMKTAAPPKVSGVAASLSFACSSVYVLHACFPILCVPLEVDVHLAMPCEVALWRYLCHGSMEVQCNTQ